MKILTKNREKRYEQVVFIHRLHQVDTTTTRYKDVKSKSKYDFFCNLLVDKELAIKAFNSKLANTLYKAHINRNKKIISSLPTKIHKNIQNSKLLTLGYATRDDFKGLSNYAFKLLNNLEVLSSRANSVTEKAQGKLRDGCAIDDLIGALVFEEFSKDKDYYIKADGHTICIENYKIIEREKFRINKWQEDNPLSLWTSIESAELHYTKDKRFELHLLMINGDKYENMKYWYFTLSGTNIKII